MRTNKEIKTMFDLFREFPFEEELVKYKFTKHPRFGSNNALELSDYVSFFAQIHTGIIINDVISKSNPELKINPKFLDKFDTLYFPPGGDPYTLRKSDGNSPYLVYYSPRGRPYIFKYDQEKGNLYNLGSYDLIISVNGIPLAIDVRISKWSGKRKRTRYSGIYGLLMNYKSKVSALETLFGDEFGYALVVSSDIFDKDIGHSSDSYCGRFFGDNGLFGRFPMTRDDFRKLVEKQVKSYGWKIKGRNV